MPISETVVVNISVFDSAPLIADFGTPLILADLGGAFVGVKSYEPSPSGLTALAADGVSITNDAYLKLQAIASQNPHCDSVKIASRAAPNEQSVTLTPAYTTAGYQVAFDLVYEGTTTSVDFNITSGDLVADICDDIVAGLGAIAGLTITDNTTDVSIELTDSSDGERFYIKNVVGVTVLDESPDAGIAADLAAAKALDDDWYGLLIDSQGSAEILLAAVFAAANNKIFGAQCADTLIVTADGGVSADIYATTNHYAYCLATRDMAGQAAACLMGREFSRTPGSTTWAHKTLTGPIADAWSGTEYGYLKAAYAIGYVNDLGQSHTMQGWACSGRFLDITRGIDWLKARIKAAILAVFLNNEKVPYTDRGAALLEAALRGELSYAESVGLLASGWDVTRPAVSTISSTTKATRSFPDLKWSGVLQGAIQSVTIDGTVTA